VPEEPGEREGERREEGRGEGAGGRGEEDAAAAHGARAVLVDCTPPDATLAYVEAIARAGVPFGAYANAGRTDRWSEASVDEYVQHARMWVEVGATIVGSCCGTDARYIAEIHRQFLGEETSLVPRSTM